MIKASATSSDGRAIYVLGITEESIRRLKRGQGILVQLEPMGGKGEVYIMYGATETAIAAELADLIGPDTVVTGVKEGGH